MTTLTISLPEELKQRIEMEAQMEDRSVSNYLVVELTRKYKQQDTKAADPKILGSMLVDTPEAYKATGHSKDAEKRREA